MRDWNNIMFDNIGQKIQKVAKVIVWINIVSFILSGFAMICYALSDFEYLWWLIFLAPVWVILGFIISWLSVITLYGFGQLVEDVRIIRQRNTGEINNYDNNKNDTTHDKNITKDKNQPKTSFDKSNDNLKSKEKSNSCTQKPNQWKCPCGRINEHYISTCACGLNKREVDIKKVLCPECGEDLSFMGWREDELKEKHSCPMCGKAILFTK